MARSLHRNLLLTVYVPSLVFTVGIGAITPVLPLVALDRGAGVALAGLMAALKGAGTTAFSMPAGLLVSRLGERRTTAMACATLAIASGLAAATSSIWTYGMLVTVIGAAWGTFNVSRIAFVAEVTHTIERGRVMASLGGIQRAGQVVGALVGGAFAPSLGAAGGFVLAAVMGGAGTLAVWWLWPHHSAFHPGTQGDRHRLWEVFMQHRSVYASAATAVMCLQILRSARDVALPLWGKISGLEPSQISTIFGMLLAVDLGVFYPVGIALDRWGRRPAYLSTAATMSVGLLLLPLTSTFATIATVGMIIGLGAGFGNGINLTLSSDFAPAQGRGEFLGVWRAITDLGSTLGPLAVAALAGLATLPIASVFVAMLGVGGFVLYWSKVPETREQP